MNLFCLYISHSAIYNGEKRPTNGSILFSLSLNFWQCNLPGKTKKGMVDMINTKNTIIIIIKCIYLFVYLHSFVCSFVS